MLEAGRPRDGEGAPPEVGVLPRQAEGGRLRARHEQHAHHAGHAARSARRSFMHVALLECGVMMVPRLPEREAGRGAPPREHHPWPRRKTWTRRSSCSRRNGEAFFVLPGEDIGPMRPRPRPRENVRWRTPARPIGGRSRAMAMSTAPRSCASGAARARVRCQRLGRLRARPADGRYRVRGTLGSPGPAHAHHGSGQHESASDVALPLSPRACIL